VILRCRQDGHRFVVGPPSSGVTWDELFERAAAEEVTVEAVHEAVERRRDGE